MDGTRTDSTRPDRLGITPHFAPTRLALTVHWRRAPPGPLVTWRIPMKNNAHSSWIDRGATSVVPSALLTAVDGGCHARRRSAGRRAGAGAGSPPFAPSSPSKPQAAPAMPPAD